jgi:A/G-specific adenine glycosylase
MTGRDIGSRSERSSLPDAAWKQSFRRRLLAWFRQNARDLPWRRTRDPYRIWISEIMLQQTQVATVIGYFERFVAAFPTVQALAEADEQNVLRLWEGLGYYRRARQLHQAARRIVAEHQQQLPRDVAALRDLPGIGRYTAGAIASIAWDRREPILEANTIRLLSRLLAFRGDPTSTAGQHLLWEFSASLLPTRQCGVFNQALMELGSRICTPHQPRCDQCPVRSLCPTHAFGLQAAIPTAKKMPRYENVLEAAVIVYRRRQVLVRQCGHGERWAGMWDFPRFSVEAEHGLVFDREIQQGVAAIAGVQIRPLHRLAMIKHGVTRFRITLLCHAAEYVSGRMHRGGSLRWLGVRQLHELPLSVTGRKISTLLLPARD